jgi:hypothetical protein
MDFMTSRNANSPSWYWPIMLVSGCAALLLVQQSAALQILGAVIVATLALVAAVQPWLGVLALLPLSFAVAVPPQTIGIKEIVFAAMTGVVVIAPTIGRRWQEGASKVVRNFGVGFAIGGAFFVVNLIAAKHENVAVQDWLRGVVPYLFLVAIIPVTFGLRDNPQRIRSLGISIGLTIFLFCGYVVGYSLGPFVDRITMIVPSSTDVFIPMGVAFGFAAAVFASNLRERIFGVSLMGAALWAVLATYTRSMLLSPFVAIGLTCIYLLLCMRERLRFAIFLLLGSGIYMAVTMHALRRSRSERFPR